MHTETFSPTPCQVGLRSALAIGISRRWTIRCGGFSTAFLHADVPDDEYLCVKPCKPLDRPNVLWRLRKALYGLRSAPKLWNEHLGKEFGKLKFTRSVADPSVFTRQDCIIVCHVGDPVIIGARHTVSEVMGALEKCMKFKRGREWSSGHWERYLG